MSDRVAPIPIPAVGVVCLRDDEVLLIRRGTVPRLGEWSLPGGRIESGERAMDAALRELKEETGVSARILGLIDVVDGIFSDEGRHYILIDFVAEWLDGVPVAGDDATEALFMPVSAAMAAVSWSETRRVMEEAVRLRNIDRRGETA